jgi:hypothetical protein
MVRSLGIESDFGQVTHVSKVGARLLATDRYLSPHLAVIDLASGRVAYRLGRNGEGPGEFREPVPTSVVGDHPGQVWVYDFYNRRLTLLDLNRTSRSAVVREVPLVVDAALEAPFWIGPRLVANGLFADYTLLLLNDRGVAVSRTVADPPFAHRLPRAAGARMANRSFLAPDPRTGRLALSYQFAGRVDFFRPDGTRYGTATGPRAVKSRFHYDSKGRFQWDRNNEMAHWGIAATSRYVYTLFCGCEMQHGSESPQLLHVYDWNGRFVAEVALDRPLRALSVSEDDSYLYGAFEEPTPGVGEWKLPVSLASGSRP